MEMLDLKTAIDAVSREKGIDSKVLIETMEQAIITAAKRTFGETRKFEASYSTETGDIDLYMFMVVVDDVADPDCEIAHEDAQRYGLEGEIGDELGFQIYYLPKHDSEAREEDKKYGELLEIQQQRKAFGRIAAQTAKQVIIQRLRDAEKDILFNAFKDRKGELVTGTVRRFERGSNIVVDLDHNKLNKGEAGKSEAILPAREQTPRENYRPGDRIVAVLKMIDREARGQQVVLSRNDPQLVVKLFESEVPEIYEGIVKIVAAAREPGFRAKIAVTSRDSDVDPVGACVGMKGSRVTAVVQELRGEKVDIVPWDRDPATFVCRAISPVQLSDVLKVIVDQANQSMELVVPDAKLSLAIGRRGQNVRLASQLTGWKLNIMGESKFRDVEDQAIAAFSAMSSADENLSKSFYRAGFRSLEEVIEASDEELATIEGVGSETRAAAIRVEAKAAMESVRKKRVAAAMAKGEPLSDRECFLLCSTLTERTIEALEKGGYRSVLEVAKETDADRLAIRTGLDATRAKEVKDEIARFVATEFEAVREATKPRVIEESSAGV